MFVELPVIIKNLIHRRTGYQTRGRVFVVDFVVKYSPEIRTRSEGRFRRTKGFLRVLPLSYT